MSANLHGILTALIAPFAHDGSLDEAGLKNLVERSIAGGVNGLVTCGSTGEFSAMTHEERKRVVEVVVQAAAGRVPVVAQTGATTAREAIELTRHAEQVGADVVMIVTPYYEPISVEETVDYLKTVSASVSVPVMLYNIPPATGINLDPELVERLADEIPNVRYIKDSSGNMEQALQLIHNLGDKIETYIGWDVLTLAGLLEGAAGIVAGAANVVPRELANVYDAVRDNDLAKARQLWNEVYPVIDGLLTEPFIPAIKAALKIQGQDFGEPRLPIHPASKETSARIQGLLEQLSDHAAPVNS
ncbi:4-hydroxy-tetrahydrodipicolinate synthase [Glutamicibacter halophytocola]|uniref:4-hydroxy-tetrahydrodipicolinate synthase n=1 Tax=Glutamicibacter halophytocola TaxID=1933880 RepID=UPI0015C5767C|nr:4-hydroxy-tetrahydrodipicolinate synthase [Glutamicibacter halophytocola]NQD42363.1 4-hydroxy-tetrahydrodipicolinate synthase [Glutamicibacter halophytocola]